MTRVYLASSVLAFSTLLAACGDDGGPQTVESKPFRDRWRTEHEGEFLVADAAGIPLISNITIGNALGSDGNFVNRGDVIVEFNGDPNTIKVELRRFTSADNEDAAADDFEKLSLWAYNANTNSPRRPADMEENARCSGEDESGDAYAWQQGCAIYLYYDGQTQLGRAGADIRVTLPPDYRQSIAISTADDVREDSYPNRGNVCVNGLDGAADIELQNGLVFVSVVSASAYPACPADLVDDCENFDDPETDGPDAWSSDCGCINLGYDPGSVQVESLSPSAADIVVDLPQDLWTSFRAENTGTNSLQGTFCPATIGDIGDVEFTDGGNDSAQPWRRQGSANQPPAAPVGGFRLDLKSNGCEAVGAVESPADWDPAVVDPDAEIRGEIELCSGCLGGMSCEDLLPG